LKLLVLTVCAAALAAPPTLARSLQIQGVTGFLNEYELTADVSGDLAESGAEELSGRLTVRHVGLCTHAGPDETLGELKLRFRGLSQKIEATLSYDGRDCAYSGFLSKSAVGTMTCTNNLALPLRLWAK